MIQEKIELKKHHKHFGDIVTNNKEFLVELEETYEQTTNFTFTMVPLWILWKIYLSPE